MTSRELRGRLLSHFYNLQYSNGGGVPVTEEILSGGEPVSREAIAGVCRDLADVGFIEWTPYRPGHVIGLARIRGPGVDAVDRRGSAVLEIQFPDAPVPATPEGEGILSPWRAPAPGVAGVLSPAPPASFLESVAPRETPRTSVQTALPVPSAEPTPPREILTLKPAFMGVSIDLKEFVRRAIAWWRARR